MEHGVLAAFLALAFAATLSQWLPLRGESVVKPSGPIRLAWAREKVGALYAFERMVAPFAIVPSGIPGTFHVMRDGLALREVLSLEEWAAARDAVFLDGDRAGGDGIVAFFPETPDGSQAAIRILYRYSATPGAVALLWFCFAAALVWVRAGMVAALASVGAFLLLLNAAGLVVPSRAKDPAIFPCGRITGGPVEPWQGLGAFEARLAPQAGESRADFALRVNSLVARNVRHLWNYGNARPLGLHVAPWSNYILWAIGEVDPPAYRYHYIAWRPALERGAGMCSQATLILVGILRERGYDARIVQLGGHTVVTAEVDPRVWHVLDPDKDVALRQSLARVESDPEVVREPYVRALQREGHDDPAYGAAEMVGFYAAEGNHMEARGGNEMMGEGWVWRERIARILVWLVPLLLILTAIAVAMKAGRTKEASQL